MSIRLLIGLGNPGREYENTRHNAGFMVLDILAAREGLKFKSERKFEGHLAQLPGGVLLLKPQTYMNLSGRSVQAVCRFFKIEPEELLVIYDDVALPEGRLRLRPGGSAGGHNGMKSIIACLGTDQFPRLRFGVGGAPGPVSLVNHVLGKFDRERREELDKSLEKAADAAIFATLHGLAAAMNRFNTEEAPKPKPPKPARRDAGTASAEVSEVSSPPPPKTSDEA